MNYAVAAEWKSRAVVKIHSDIHVLHIQVFKNIILVEEFIIYEWIRHKKQ